MVDELPSGYYLNNFMLILDFVDQLYPDILSQEEKDFSCRFRMLPDPARQLFVRLISRKGPHFRKDKVQYPEIPDIGAAARDLSQVGILEINQCENLLEILDLLRKDELIQLLSLFQDQAKSTATGWRSCRREQIFEQAARLPLTPEIFQGFFDWYTPGCQEIILTYRLLFFGNLNQDLTEFVLVDLGLLRYETYSINPDDRLFSSRCVVEETLALARTRARLYEALEAEDGATIGQIADQLLNAPPTDRSRRKQGRILEHCGRFFERTRDLKSALRCYQAANYHPANERSARILDRLGHAEEALNLCSKILAESNNVIEREFALQFRQKLQKKLGHAMDKTSRIDHPTQKMTLVREPELPIEEQVLKHLRIQGREGFYSENHFWQSLLGLLFWDIIFMPVKGAFFNYYQRGPRDLFSASFRENREAEIEARLEEIRTKNDWREWALSLYDQKQGIANYLVHWQALDRHQLVRSLSVLKNHHVADICQRLLSNPGVFKTGLPDLFVFQDPETYLLIEVKGPADQLQDNQRRWLRFFARKNIPYCVARIHWEKSAQDAKPGC